MCTDRDLFRRTVLQKCRKVNNLDCGSGVEYLKNSNIPQSKQNSAALWQFFLQIKVRQLIGRKEGFYANTDPNH